MSTFLGSLIFCLCSCSRSPSTNPSHGDDHEYFTGFVDISKNLQSWLILKSYSQLKIDRFCNKMLFKSECKLYHSYNLDQSTLGYAVQLSGYFGKRNMFGSSVVPVELLLMKSMNSEEMDGILLMLQIKMFLIHGIHGNQNDERTKPSNLPLNVIQWST